MKEKVKIWTRQDENILDVLENEERYIVKKEYIENKLESCAKYYFEVYSWYTNKASEIVLKPHDVKYPVWVSITPDFMLQQTPGTVILELLVEKDLVIVTDSEKWDRVVNFWYLPLSKEDEEEYDKKLKDYGISNCSNAYMSGFYPHLKNEIIKSWDRLFDNSYSLSNLKQGTIWEVKKEWVQRVIR
ncbi:DUF3841 domain-containing protein [Clostridium sp. OS1-26]|uniref:DUF3841 domain-containing protein n=1 Tax=Clostridium sp. OS1-26 TaxID=3070681 RepID=UPI0027E20FF0|nr:DUF3841 domain-containing protein [Clostridium sp. OS1-26]WML34709.1 DUF3841 domain-containing protein [Clostridium sp. OS1-26]